MPLIAIINTSVETIDMLRDLLEDEGFAVVATYVVRLKRGEQDLTSFFAEHRPQAVLYDIAIPYEENWDFLQQQVPPASGLAERQFVLTTTNKAALEHLVGPTAALEIIGKPFDLEVLMLAVRRAVAGSR
jgi:CheY-like chemotaxis protein